MIAVTRNEALSRVRTVNETMARHGIRMAILARPPDDATTQADIDARLEACRPYLMKVSLLGLDGSAGTWHPEFQA